MLAGTEGVAGIARVPLGALVDASGPCLAEWDEAPAFPCTVADLCRRCLIRAWWRLRRALIQDSSAASLDLCRASRWALTK